jgi:hypothetical protein
MPELQLFENHVRNFILVDPARAKKHGGDLTLSPLVIATPALSYQLPNANGIYIVDCRVIAADSSESRSGQQHTQIVTRTVICPPTPPKDRE